MNRKSIVLVILAVAFLLAGVSEVVFGAGPNAQAAQWAHTIISIFLIFLWYRFDSDDRGYRRHPLLNVGVVALAVVAVPTYLFMSRGAKGGAVSIGWLLFYFVGCMVLAGAGAAITAAIVAA